MKLDMFDTRTDKEKVVDWALSQKFIKTSDVYRWGVEHFSNRAVRNLQDFVERNPDKIRRLTDAEVDRMFGKTKEGIWMVLIDVPEISAR